MDWSAQDSQLDDISEDDLDITLLPAKRILVPMIVASVVGAAISTAMLLSLLGPAPAVLVPPVVGISLADAKKTVQARGFGLLVADTMSDPLVVAGAVSLQDPVAGELRAPGQLVLVTLSSGKPTHKLPDRASTAVTPKAVTPKAVTPKAATP